MACREEKDARVHAPRRARFLKDSEECPHVVRLQRLDQVRLSGRGAARGGVVPTRQGSVARLHVTAAAAPVVSSTSISTSTTTATCCYCCCCEVL